MNSDDPTVWSRSHALEHERIDAAPGIGFAFFDTSDRRNRFEWHAHAKHQLLFVESGVVLLQTTTAALPLHRGIGVLVSAGTVHETTVSRGCAFGSVFLEPRRCPARLSECLRLEMTPLLRAMLDRARRWQETETRDGAAERFFAALADVVAEEGQSFSAGSVLPAPRHETVRSIVALALERLEDARLSRLAEAVGTPERTARRLIRQDLGMGWRSYLRMARVGKAVQLLETSDRTVSEIGFAVGFESLSAFTHAFSEVMGSSPKQFRQASEGKR